MKLSRSSFYYKPKSQSPERREAEADLRDKIEAICLEYTRYGYRRVTHELRHRECHVNHKDFWLKVSEIVSYALGF